MNRLSTTSLPEDDGPAKVEYRIHQASTCSSARSSFDCDEAACVDRISTVSSSPAAHEFEIVAESDDRESANSDYYSAIERLGSISGDEAERAASCAIEKKYTEEEWSSLEVQVEAEAVHARDLLSRAVSVSPGTVKLVDIKRHKQQSSNSGFTSPLYQHQSYSTPDLAILESLKDILRRVVTRSQSSDGLKHDSLPYQAYSGSFDPFKDSGTSVEQDQGIAVSRESKERNRGAKIVQDGSKVELHLAPAHETSDLSQHSASGLARTISATSTYESSPAFGASHIDPLATVPGDRKRTSWLDTSPESITCSSPPRSTAACSPPTSASSSPSSTSSTSTSTSSPRTLPPGRYLSRTKACIGVGAGGARPAPPPLAMNAAYPILPAAVRVPSLPPPAIRSRVRPRPQRVYTCPSTLSIGHDFKTRFYGPGGAGEHMALTTARPDMSTAALPSMRPLPTPPHFTDREVGFNRNSNLAPPRPAFATHGAAHTHPMMSGQSHAHVVHKVKDKGEYVNGSRWQRPLSAIPEDEDKVSHGGDGDEKEKTVHEGVERKVWAKERHEDQSKSWRYTRVGHFATKLARRGGMRGKGTEW